MTDHCETSALERLRIALERAARRHVSCKYGSASLTATVKDQPAIRAGAVCPSTDTEAGYDAWLFAGGAAPDAVSLNKALKRERRRARSRSATYDLNRHLQLLQAYKEATKHPQENG